MSMEVPIEKKEEVAIVFTASEANVEHLKQASSVLRILHNTYEKLKISLILTKILYNVHALKKYLTKDEFTECVGLLQGYLKDREKHMRKGSQDFLNLRLIKVIDFFHEKYDILQYFARWMDQLSEVDASLLKAFQLLLDISEQRLTKSAFFELNRDHKIFEVFQQKDTVQKNVEEYEHQMKSNKVNLRWKLAAKEGVIKRHEELITHKKEIYNALIKEQMIKNSWAVRQMHTASLTKQLEMEEALRVAKLHYKAILYDNLKQERSTRDEKNKLVLQIEGLMQKYDQSIGDKLREKMSLQEQYEKQRKLFTTFMITFKKKEAEYDEIVTKKIEEELRIQEKKVMMFIYNRAARIIQRFYRRYLKQHKRQLKKKRGGKTAKAAKVGKTGKVGKTDQVIKADKGSKRGKGATDGKGRA